MKHIFSVISATIALLCVSSGFSFQNALMVDSHNQIKKTTDGGRTWQVIPDGQRNKIHARALAKTSAHSFNAVVVKNGRRTTTDGGQTWKSETDGNKSAPGSRFSVYPNPANGGNINIKICEELKGKSLEISFCDIFGNRFMTASISNKMTEPGVITLDLGNLQSGFYILRITSYFGEDLTGVLIK